MSKDPLLGGKPGVIQRVQVPLMRYFAVDGQGAPGGDVYSTAVAALYALAYGTRFAGKALGHDDKVGPLEGLWWADDMAAFLNGERDMWRWTMMIRAPGWLDDATFETVREAAVTKRRRDKPAVAEALAGVALKEMHEGDCLQALHLGPYADEAPLIARMHAQAAADGLALHGPHHEIYLSDPNRTAAEKLKTVIRQPVRAQA